MHFFFRFFVDNTVYFSVSAASSINLLFWPAGKSESRQISKPCVQVNSACVTPGEMKCLGVIHEVSEFSIAGLDCPFPTRWVSRLAPTCRGLCKAVDRPVAPTLLLSACPGTRSGEFFSIIPHRLTGNIPQNRICRRFGIANLYIFKKSAKERPRRLP